MRSEAERTPEDDTEPVGHSIPSTWVWTDFERAFGTVPIKAKVPTSHYLEVGTVPVIDQGQQFIGGYTNDAEVAMQPGDGLIVFGDHTRAFKRITFPFAAGADGIKLLRPLLADLNYSFFACLSLRFPNKGYARHYSHLRRCKFPLAPGREQKRIVSKIEELFSQIEEGERVLERVRKLVDRYRQSVLKAAVTGELTRAWRDKNEGESESGEALLTRILEARRKAWEKSELGKMKAKGQRPNNGEWKRKYKDPVPPDTSNLPELPNGWTWASIDQLCLSFCNGLSAKPAHNPPGLPILRISAVRPLLVDDSDVRYYIPGEGEALESFYARTGDLLFTRYNGSKQWVGASGVYRGATPVLHPDKLIRGRVVSERKTPPDYLVIAFNSGETWKHISDSVKTSAGQHGVAGSDLKRAPVPLPPSMEQEEIADLFAQIAQKCEVAASLCSQELQRSSGLKQTVLRSAFAGKLVPQDSYDEPASVLLERIAVERNGSPKLVGAKSSRKKKVKA